MCGRRGPRLRIPGDKNRRIALSVLWQAFPARSAVVGLFCLLGGVLPALFMVLVSRLATDLPGAVDGGWASSGGHAVVRTLAAIGGVLAVQELVAAVREVLRWDLYRRYEEYLVARVMRATVSAPDLELFEDPELARLTDRAVRIAQFEPGDLVDGLSTKWSARAPGLAAVVVVATVWPIAAVLVALVWWVAGRQMQADSRRGDREVWAEAIRQAAYVGRLGQEAEWAKEVRVFGLVDWLSARFGWHWDTVLAEMAAARRTGRARTLVVVGAALAVNAAVLGLAVRGVVVGSLDVGQITLLAQGLLAVAAIASYAGDQLIEYGASRPPVVLELEQAIARQAPAVNGTRPAAGLPRQDIRLERVRFGYPGRDRAVFDELTLRIEAGRSLAIVGLNGAGKTTLVKLLTGLEHPQRGRILIDGIDLTDIDLNSWRRSVAAIFQDFTRYHLSARDNIAFGAVETLSAGSGAAEEIDDELFAAASRAGAEGVLSELPHGLDTPLSQRYAGGVDLSGGQWQRIALARALHAVRFGARTLILDEPTAQLDVRAEADLYDRFLELSHGLTTIVISHRFSTVRRADRIVVLDNGRIREDGTHDELVAADGVYARLFHKQASRYSTDSTYFGDDDA